MKTFSFTLIWIIGLLLTSAPSLGARAVVPNDIIAKVGDQTITFSNIEIMINSSDLVGMGIPPPGTPDRNQVRLIILDKVISADLLYLDALKKGMENNPVYQNDVDSFSKSILSSMYQERQGIANIPVTDKEVRSYFKKNMAPGTPFTPQVRVGIESKIRKERFVSKKNDLQKGLRKGIQIAVDSPKLNPDGDASRASGEVVARVDQEKITWGELRRELSDPNKNGSLKARLDALNEIIDDRIAEKKAEAARLDQDPVYLSQMQEFKKVTLVSLYKSKLLAAEEPTDREIREYFEKNKEKVSEPESRKIQMVVLKTRAEADSVKKRIKSGEITMFEAASTYSVDPNAKQTLGELGWVAKGTGFRDLDRLTFSLKPGEVGGPVESPAGWHLVKVEEVREGKYQSINDRETRKRARNMLMREKRDEYVANLRKNVFPVQVYDDVIQRIVKQEAKRTTTSGKVK